MVTRILVADDDSAIRELLRYVLGREGYAVLEAEDGADAVSLLEREQAQLAVVDVMMPAMDGLQLCRYIREHHDIPVIMLTAKGDIADKERAFRSGTDDYVVKPFEPQELLFRIRALLRRYRLVSPEAIRLGRVTIDRQGGQVSIEGEPLYVPLREFELLSQLAAHPGRIYTREQLIRLVWGVGYEGDGRTVDVHIKRLRERFADCADDFVITTIRGLGYKLEAGGR